MTGPRYVVEGTHGLAQALGEPIRIDWDRVKLDAFDRLALKSYNTAVPGQASIHCMLELRKAHAIDPAQVESIENDVFQDAYDFMGGGSFGPKTDVQTKEEADHSLPYLLAVALLDGSVQPAQLAPERIGKPDAQMLLRKVKVRPDESFTARYPRARRRAGSPSGSTNGKSWHLHEVSDYPRVRDAAVHLGRNRGEAR